MIKIEDFISHIEKNETPLAPWPDLIQSLWWVKKGSWEKAHNLAQEIESSDGSWVHTGFRAVSAARPRVHRAGTKCQPSSWPRKRPPTAPRLLQHYLRPRIVL